VKSVAFHLHQHHPIIVRLSPPRSVSCTREWVFHTHQHVKAPPPPQLSPAATDGGFLLSAMSTTRERSSRAGTWSTLAGAGENITAKVCCPFVVGFILSLCVYIAGLDLCARPWSGKHRYFEVLRSYVFQLRSINSKWPLHHTLHTIGFPARSPSIHCQLLRL
jgi:hypothetical protein